MAMTSNRPYLLRAIYEWLVDNNCTPHIIVFARADNVSVPQQHVDKEGQIILNVSPTAVKDFFITNEGISFNELSKKYAHKINILAISQDKKEQIQAFLTKHIFDAQIVSDAEAFINKYNLGSGYPFTLLLNKEGKVEFEFQPRT